jgi:hypothetical protein
MLPRVDPSALSATRLPASIAPESESPSTVVEHREDDPSSRGKVNRFSNFLAGETASDAREATRKRPRRAFTNTSTRQALSSRLEPALTGDANHPPSLSVRRLDDEREKYHSCAVLATRLEFVFRKTLLKTKKK